MRVTLIFTGISSIGFSSYGKSREGTWISHGLCSISAALKSRGHVVNLLDLRKMSGWKEAGELLVRQKPDVVGATMMSVDFEPAVKALRISKRKLPEVPTCVGGPHPSLVPEEIEPFDFIDYIFIGESEVSFPDALDALTAGDHPPPRLVPSIHPNLDELPMSDRRLFGEISEASVDADVFPEPFVTLIAGRGCRYNCSFCQPAEKKIFGKTVRRRSPGNVIEELLALHAETEFNSFMIHDDCLTEDPEWIREFCERYVETGLNKPFLCQSRADLICAREHMINGLKDAGLKAFIIGFESGSDRVLKFLRKGASAAKNLRAAEICKENQILIWANYMMGIPTETKEEVRMTVDMIRKIKPHWAACSYYTPHPGSDLYDYCIENDLSLIKDHASFRRGGDVKIEKIKGVDYEYLHKMMELSVFSAPEYYLRRILKVPVQRLLGRSETIKRWVKTVARLCGVSKSERGV